jgi:hypothetical protein
MTLTKEYRLHAAPSAISAAIDREYRRMRKSQVSIRDLQALLALRYEQIHRGVWPAKKEDSDGTE